jgi:hypothetical protein
MLLLFAVLSMYLAAADAIIRHCQHHMELPPKPQT